MPVYFNKARRRWLFQLRRTVSGRIIRTSKLLPAGWDRAKAEAFDRAETARLFGIAAGTLRESPGIETAIALYLDHHRDARNIRKCKQDLAALFGYYEGRTFDDLPNIAAEVIRDHRDTLAPATIRNRLAYLRAAVRWAWRHQRMGDRDPASGMLMPAVHNERQSYLTVDQVHALANACKCPGTAALVRLAFYTGLRWIRELKPRQPSDVIVLDGTTWLLAGMTKNGLPRMVPIPPAALADLEQLPFTLDAGTYYRDFLAARKALGLDHIRMHDLRHSLASAIISQGNSLQDVKAALGHVSHTSSQRYSHLYPERLKAVIWQVGEGKKPAQKRPKVANRKAVDRPKRAA